jgi:hypothetical protein
LRPQAGVSLLIGYDAYEIGTADHDKIAAFSASVEQKLETFEKERERIKAEFMAASEDELFAEWEG